MSNVDQIAITDECNSADAGGFELKQCQQSDNFTLYVNGIAANTGIPSKLYIAENPALKAEHGKSTLQAAIGSALNRNSERHQRAEEMAAARMGKCNSYRVMREYMCVKLGGVDLKEFVALTGDRDLADHQKKMIDSLMMAESNIVSFGGRTRAVLDSQSRNIDVTVKLSDKDNNLIQELIFDRFLPLAGARQIILEATYNKLVELGVTRQRLLEIAERHDQPVDGELLAMFNQEGGGCERV